MTAATPTPAPTFVPPASPTVVEIWNAALDTRLVDSVPFYGPELSIDDPLSEVGLLSGRVGLDEEAATQLVDGNHVRVVIAGEDAFTAMVEPEVEKQHITVDGQAAQMATFKCRGHVIDLDSMPIDAFGGIDARPQALTRPMTWCSPEADLSGLDPVTILFDELSVEWATPQTDPPWWSPWLPPKGFPDETAAWFWSSAPDPVTGHPPQTRRFVNDITISDDGLYAFWCAADDGFTLFGNGIQLGKGNEDPADSFIRPWTGCWNLTAGTLRIGIEGYNYARPDTPAVGTFGGPNIGRVAFALYYLPDGVNTVLSDALLVAHSDDTWLTLDTDDPLPAPTWGKILDTFLTEGQAEDMGDGWALSCSPTLTSLGTPWTERGDQSFGISDDTSFLSVLRQGASSGCIDWRPDPSSKAIHVANFGEMNTPHAATFTEDDGTLIDLRETTVAGFCNSLAVRHKTGREIVEDLTSIGTYGRKRRSLPLADLDRDAAVAQAQRELDVRKVRRSSFTAAIEVDAGTSSAPYGVGGWVPGDAPTFRTEHVRVVRISTTFDAGGNPIFVPELQTRLQGAAERQQIMASKAGASLGGTSRAATALEGVPSKTIAGFVRDADDLVFTQIQLTPAGMESLYDVSPPRKWKHPARVWFVEIAQFVPPQDLDTIVNIIQSGPGGTVTLAVATLPVGYYRAGTLVWYGHVGEFDNVHAEWVQHDVAVDDPDNPDLDARWCTVTVRAVDANPASIEPAPVEVPW